MMDVGKSGSEKTPSHYNGDYILPSDVLLFSQDSGPKLNNLNNPRLLLLQLYTINMIRFCTHILAFIARELSLHKGE